MKIAADRRGRLWLLALGGLAGLGLIWTGLWFFAAQRLSNHLLLSRADGATLARLCGDKQIGGFPFRLRLRCAGFAAPLHVANGQIIAKADEANGEASVFAPNHIVLSLTSPLTFVRANGSSFARMEYDHLSVDLHWSGRQLIDTFATARGVNWTPEAPAALVPFKLQSLEVQLKPVESEAGLALRFDMLGEGLQLPVLNAILRADTPGQLKASGDIRPFPASESEITQGWRVTAENWREKQGTINFETIEFVDGLLQLHVSGPLSLDEAHRLAGRLNIQASGAGPVMARLGLPAQIGQVQGILGALFGAPPKTNSGSDTLALTVTLAQGRISLGPLRLPWALTPLY